MTGLVAAAVLAAAVLHAAWNAVVKRRTDRLTLFACASLVWLMGLAPVLPWVDLPARASWPWLGASVAVHVLYNAGLMAAYRIGDFNQSYPIARGVGPLLVAGVAGTVLGESLSVAATVGVVLIAASVGVLGLIPWRSAVVNRRAVALAALTGVTIAGYTLIDGVGVRASGSSFGYTAWLVSMQSGVTLAAIMLLRRSRSSTTGSPPPVLARAGSPWVAATAVGGMSMAAYALVLWAQTRGALAAVAALRECSVVVAAVIGSVFFGEPVGRARVAASVGVAAGAMLLAVAAT